MVKLAHIADCHLRQTQYGSRARGRDFYNGLYSAVRTACGLHVDAILCAGDLLDGPYPSAEIIADQLGTINAFLRCKKIPMLVINGNHDNTKTPWASVFNSSAECRLQDGGIFPIDHSGASIGSPADCISIKGVPYCSPEELRDTLTGPGSDAYVADVLMWHGEIKEFCGYPREGCIEMQDFPLNTYKLIAMGDQHIHKMLQREEDGLIVAYPGSTELCSSSEDPCKKMFVYTFDKGVITDIQSVPFQTRKVQKFTITSPEDLEHAYSAMAPGALVFVDYISTVKGVLARLSSFVETWPETILRPAAITEQKTKVEFTKQYTAEDMPTLQAFTHKALSDGLASDDVAKLVTALTDPVCDHKTVVNDYCEQKLENTYGKTSS